MYRNYGLTGKTVKVKKTLKEDGIQDPWAYTEQKMKIEAEYPSYLVATVLPHRNPKGFGMSRPYRTTLHKNDIKTGVILLNGGEIK